MTRLDVRALQGIAQFMVVLALCIFVPAWTIDYWQAWILLTVLLVSVMAVTVWLMKHDRKLLERRMNAGPTGEKHAIQKIIMTFATLAFIALIVIPALDHRLAWSSVPVAGVLVGNALVLVGFYIVYRVFKENSFTAATVEIHQDQKVVSSGPYGWVRHPMYIGGLIFMAGIPLALGSYWGLVAMLPLTAVIVWRLIDEEKLLVKELPGYAEYRVKVPYRLVPYIW